VVGLVRVTVRDMGAFECGCPDYFSDGLIVFPRCMGA
jgi:hypothetical protein